MKINKLNQIDINDFTIRVMKNKNGTRNIHIEFDNSNAWDTLAEKYGDYITCSYNTKSKTYSNLKEGIVDKSTLSPEQINNFKQSILQRLKFLLSKKKKSINNMRENIIESAVKNSTNKKDKDLDVSEFDFSEVENKDFNFDTLLKEDNKEIKIDDFNFEELDEFEEYDTDKEFLEEIEDRENQIKLIDKKIQSELDFFVEVRLDIAKAEKTISDLNELLAERKEVLNQHMEDKVQLRLDIEDFKTCLKYTK